MRDLHLCRYIWVLCGYQKWQMDLRAKQFDLRVYGFYVYFLVFFELGFLGFIRKPRFVFQGLEFHTYFLWGCLQRSAFICAGAFQCCAQVLENGKFDLSEPFVLRKSENQFQCITTVTLKIKIEGKNHLETCSSFMKTTQSILLSFLKCPNLEVLSSFILIDLIDMATLYQLTEHSNCKTKTSPQGRKWNEILELSRKSPCLHPLFWPAFTPYPLFQCVLKFYSNLSMKCWNSASNAQGLRVIIIVVQLGAVKIYVTPVQALRKKGKTEWNLVYHQNWWKN
jgi:hypothetical protein